MEQKNYSKPAFIQAVVATCMLLIVGFVVATVTQNIGTSISVKSYNNVATDVANIDLNNLDGVDQFEQDANATLAAGFKAQRTNAENIPLLSQATFLGVIILVLFGAINATVAGAGGSTGKLSF